MTEGLFGEQVLTCRVDHQVCHGRDSHVKAHVVESLYVSLSSHVNCLLLQFPICVKADSLSELIENL